MEAPYTIDDFLSLMGADDVIAAYMDPDSVTEFMHAVNESEDLSLSADDAADAAAEWEQICSSSEYNEGDSV